MLFGTRGEARYIAEDANPTRTKTTENFSENLSGNLSENLSGNFYLGIFFWAIFSRGILEFIGELIKTWWIMPRRALSCFPAILHVSAVGGFCCLYSTWSRNFFFDCKFWSKSAGIWPGIIGKSGEIWPKNPKKKKARTRACSV
jgi:hypothetical protein